MPQNVAPDGVGQEIPVFYICCCGCKDTNKFQKWGQKNIGNYPKYTPKPKVGAKNSLFYQKEGANYYMNDYMMIICKTEKIFGKLL